jgi:hypothetical protein
MGHFSDKYREFLNAPEDLWVESGTYRGESIAKAVEFGFRELHSIEVCPALYEQAKTLYAADARVRLHLGSSPEALRKIIHPEWTARNTVFWLDAHYQGHGAEEYDPVIGECPLLLELDAILSRPWRARLVLAIDDIRTFKDEFWVSSPLAERFKRVQWPTLNAITHKLKGFQFRETEEVLYASK